MVDPDPTKAPKPDPTPPTVPTSPSGTVPQGATPNETRSFREHLRANRYEILTKIVAFILGAVVFGTVLMLGQEFLKRHFFDDSTKLRIQLDEAAAGIFPDSTTTRLYQLLKYEVSSSDFVSQMQIDAVFPNGTSIQRVFVRYSVDLAGFTTRQEQTNQVTILLQHPLDVSKTATVYLMTYRSSGQFGDPGPQLPNIHVTGKDRKGAIVYY